MILIQICAAIVRLKCCYCAAGLFLHHLLKRLPYFISSIGVGCFSWCKKSHFNYVYFIPTIILWRKIHHLLKMLLWRMQALVCGRREAGYNCSRVWENKTWMAKRKCKPKVNVVHQKTPQMCVDTFRRLCIKCSPIFQKIYNKTNKMSAMQHDIQQVF